MTLSVSDWRRVRDRCGELMGEIRPVPYNTLVDAVYDVISEDELGTFGASTAIKTATEDGTLGQLGGNNLSNSQFDFRGVDPDGSSDEESEDEFRDTVPDVPNVTVQNTAEASGHEFVPDALRNSDIWYVRHPDDKTLRAPWAENQYCGGTLKNALWKQSLESSERADTDYQTVQYWVDTHPDHLEVMDWGDFDPDTYTLAPAVLLPHEPDDPCISVIDLDDVRRPSTGEIHPDAARIIREADSWAEISQSGEGIHVFVHGSLPETHGNLVEPISDEPWVGDEIPKIEVYDHARVVAVTEQHVTGTPSVVNDADTLLDEIVETYGSRDASTEDVLEEREDTSRGGCSSDLSSSRDTSPYYSIDTADVIQKAGLDNDLTDAGQGMRGSHPVHGSTTGTNFQLDDDGGWYCYRGGHEAGGYGMHLAVVEVLNVGCDWADDLSQLSDTELLSVCLHIRDWGVVNGDEKPPYAAVRGVLKEMDLVDEQNHGEIPSGLYSTGRSVYDNNSLADLREKLDHIE